jgi:hypothetical protein
MPFRPNYNQRRSDRRRAQLQKHEEKQQRREEKAAQRKAARDETSPPRDDPANLTMEDTMARKKPITDSGFVLFDVIYQDGTRTSNRKVASAEIDALDADASARAIIEAQDRKIAEMSGRPRGPIKSIDRSTER